MEHINDPPPLPSLRGFCCTESISILAFSIRKPLHKLHGQNPISAPQLAYPLPNIIRKPGENPHDQQPNRHYNK